MKVCGFCHSVGCFSDATGSYRPIAVVELMLSPNLATKTHSGTHLKMATFNDAQEMKKVHQATFWAPTADALAAARAGSLVKICADDVERFWVNVTEVEGNRLQGTVDNDLLHTEVHQLKCDDVVSFELRHIYQIYQD